MDNKKLSIPIVILSVFILLASFFLIKEIISIKTVLDNIDKTENRIRDLNEKLVYLKGYEKNAEEMIKMLEKYKKALPESSGIGEIILTMEQLALDNSIQIMEIRFDEGKAEGVLNKLPIYVSATGEYFDIIGFINGIKEDERIYTFESIYIEKDNDTQELIADLDINVYNLIIN
jgi:Tfp pilus assembly protein PilO